MAPARIGNYVIEREIGSGGMGSVYLGRSRAGRAVAIKVIRAEYAADHHYRARFRKEVEAARRVGGFHTAAVVDADPDAPQPWMASAYVKGPTLAAEIERRGPLTEDELWWLAAALAEALEAIHACGLVHRDLKPANIVLADDGPRVLDFGIARPVDGTRMTGDGAWIGTPGFLAPEQAQGHAATGACDVFALGAVLVAAAGGSAFGGGAAYGLMYRAVHEEADVSAVPGALRPIVMECLRKAPERRPSPRRLLDLCTGDMDDARDGFRDGSHPETAPDGPDSAPTATATRRAASPSAPPAVYRRGGRSWAAQVLRNLFYVSACATAVALTSTVYKPGPVTVVGFVGALLIGIRLLGLVTTRRERLLLNDLGIGVGAPNNLIVLHWSDIASLEMDAGPKVNWLTVRLRRGYGLPTGFQHPSWVRQDAKGTTTRIHTGPLSPSDGSPPLPETIRTLAERNQVAVSLAEPRTRTGIRTKTTD